MFIIIVTMDTAKSEFKVNNWEQIQLYIEIKFQQFNNFESFIYILFYLLMC